MELQVLFIVCENFIILWLSFIVIHDEFWYRLIFRTCAKDMVKKSEHKKGEKMCWILHATDQVANICQKKRGSNAINQVVNIYVTEDAHFATPELSLSHGKILRP